MCKKISVYSAVIFLLVLIFGCTNESLINGLIYKAHAQFPYPTTTTITTTTSPTADPCTINPCAAGCPGANTCTCNSAYCTPIPTATVAPIATATPFICGSSGDSECSGKLLGASCTITEDDNGVALIYPIDGTCSGSCKCEFCEICNSCFGSFDAGSFVGSYDSSTTPIYNPDSTFLYRKMFNVTSTLEQIGSDLRQIKESRKNKAYKKKVKFVRSYKENDDGTLSVLVKSKVKENDILTQKESWLKFRVGDACSKTTKVRGRDVPTGECQDPGPCKAPCEKCKRRNPTSTTDKCCFCRLDRDPPTNAKCSPDHDTPVAAGDVNSCIVLKGPGHKCDAAACKCKCGAADPCDVQCEFCDASVDPRVCKLLQGNTCSATSACKGGFNCIKAGTKCFCGCTVEADCSGAGAGHCCQGPGETSNRCHECCEATDCPAAKPVCCGETKTGGKIKVCGVAADCK